MSVSLFNNSYWIWRLNRTKNLHQFRVRFPRSLIDKGEIQTEKDLDKWDILRLLKEINIRIDMIWIPSWRITDLWLYLLLLLKILLKVTKVEILWILTLIRIPTILWSHFPILLLSALLILRKSRFITQFLLKNHKLLNYQKPSLSRNCWKKSLNWLRNWGFRMNQVSQ
jgi:hypothetical protein